MNVDVPADASKSIQALVASGEFESPEQVVVEGVRLLMTRKQVREEIQKGIDELDAGLGISGEEVFAELEERARRLLGDKDR